MEAAQRSRAAAQAAEKARLEKARDTASDVLASALGQQKHATEGEWGPWVDAVWALPCFCIWVQICSLSFCLPWDGVGRARGGGGRGGGGGRA